jgi:hypothetical protein
MEWEARRGRSRVDKGAMLLIVWCRLALAALCPICTPVARTRVLRALSLLTPSPVLTPRRLLVLWVAGVDGATGRPSPAGSGCSPSRLLAREVLDLRGPCLGTCHSAGGSPRQIGSQGGACWEGRPLRWR